MSDTTLHSLRDIARELDLPESTVRYYRDAFAPHITTVGTGRRRRYPAEAVAILRTIAEGYAAGKTRDEIEHELAGGTPTARPQPGDVPASRLETEDLLATVLDGERERREAMWQMAREIVRLGEAIERQQVMLGGIAGQLTQADRTLPPPAASTDALTPEHAEGVAEEPAPAEPRTADGDAVTLERELAALSQELESERTLVERLRKSKLEIERRAAEAEAQLDERGPGGPHGSLLRRLLRRSTDAGDG